MVKCVSAKGHVWQQINPSRRVWRCLRCGATQISAEQPRTGADPRGMAEKNRETVIQLLPKHRDKLKEAWIQALEMRFGLGGYEPSSYDEISEALGLTRITVDKMVRTAIRSLEGYERRAQWEEKQQEDQRSELQWPLDHAAGLDSHAASQ